MEVECVLYIFHLIDEKQKLIFNSSLRPPLVGLVLSHRAVDMSRSRNEINSKCKDKLQQGSIKSRSVTRLIDR